jgi:hypothetical protein
MDAGYLEIRKWGGNVLAAVFMRVSKVVTFWNLPSVSLFAPDKKLLEHSIVFDTQFFWTLPVSP